jgi:hypothetical protein
MSIRGEKTFQNFFPIIVEHTTSLGHTALSELNPGFKPAAPLTDSEIFSRDVKWIDKSRVLIAEISGASTGVGFEIAYALYKKKIPVLALANREVGSNISAMINGCDSKLLTLKYYENSEDLKKILSAFLKTNNE